MKLLLDIGNSAVKWALADSRGALEHQGRFARPLLDSPRGWAALQASLPAAGVQGIAVASVAGEQDNTVLRQRLAGISDLRPWFAGVQPQSCGVRCAYADCAQLGVDRWLIIIAAWCQVQDALCVIDYGTAVSVDMVDRKGRHLGGYVLPGLAMMQEALRRGTARIPPGPASDPGSPGPGVDTASCVARGCLGALAGGCDRLVQEYAQRLGQQPHCLVTGGGAAAILPAVGFSFVEDQQLLFRGLQRLFQER